MELFRLDSVAPVAASSFRQAPSDKRRAAVLLACQEAVAATGLTAADVGTALAVLRGDAPADVSLRTRLESVATGFDEEYFQLDEDGGASEKLEALHFFSKARATSALVFALTSDDSQLHEAIYEAISALEEPGELISLVERALG